MVSVIIMMYKVKSVTTEKANEYQVTFVAQDQRLFELTVHEELILMYRLVVGKELTSDQFEAIHAKLDLGKAYQYAVNLLSRRSYTQGEMIQKLLAREYEDFIVDEVMKRLVQSEIINDQYYAIQYVSHHMNLGKKGPNLLNRELLEKQINQCYVTEALKLYSDEKQQENIERLHQQQIRQNNKYGSFYLKQKVSQNLMLKGFNRELIEACVNQVTIDDEDERELLEKELLKLMRKHQKLDEFKKKTKVIQTLARKGYSFDMITSVYERIKQENEY